MRPWAAHIAAYAFFMGFLMLMNVPCHAAPSDEADPGPMDKVSVLADSLADPDPAIRRAAARGLGEERDARAVPPLMEIVNTDADESVRLAALGSLVMIDDRSAVPAYETALRDRSEMMRQSAAEALNGIWLESAHKALVDALRTDPSEKVRRAVAEALGNPGILGRYKAHNWQESELTESALIKALGSDKDYGVRAISAKMLGKFKSRQSFDALIKAFTGDKNSSVKTAAARSLGDLEMDEAVGVLIEAVTFESDENVVSAALESLKYLEDEKIPEAAAEALRSTSPMVRWQAIDVLEYRGARDYEDTLRYVMDDDYEPEGIRHKAMEALQSMGLE